MEKQFKTKHFNVYVVNIKDKSLGISSPIIININRFEEFAKDNILPDKIKNILLDALFHEILNNYIVENFYITILLDKNFYRESRLTKNHIYLYAIQQCVYRNLKKSYLIDVLKTKKYSAYQKAYDIVGDDCNFFLKKLRENVILN